MIEWADRFDAQIFLHTGDREWVMRKSSTDSVLGRNNFATLG